METLTELLPAIRVLSRTDKLRVVQYLVSELVREEPDLLTPDMTYPVWSPYDACEAADTLLKTLEADKNDDSDLAEEFREWEAASDEDQLRIEHKIAEES